MGITDNQIDALDRAARHLQLEVFGALHDAGDTVILLGPHEPGFWATFSASPEGLDGTPDPPLDRWSKRIIGTLARDWGGGQALFPSDGPPYPPFLAWAQDSGRAWPSPIGMLVHDRAGLWASYRGGAVRLAGGALPLPEAGGQSPPCVTCPEQPCRTACPVAALSQNYYDTEKCHGFLDTTAGGEDCMTQGCAARRACPPVSASYGRLPQQSHFHMKAFHKT